MTDPANEWILLAELLRPQGRKGEILAESFTDFPESLAGRDGLFLAPSGFAGAESAARACSITDAWLPRGKNEGRVVLAIGAVTNIDQAEALSGLELIVRAEHRQALEADAAYISDIVGSTLFDRGNLVGQVRDLQFPTSPDGRRRLENAAPLLVVTSGDDELLIPFVRDHIDRTDTAARELHMRLPAGLIEVQRADSLPSKKADGAADPPHDPTLK